MPDFTGMGMSESLGMLLEIKKGFTVTYALHGTGKVSRQRPAAGTRLESGAAIDLYLKE
jgi:beta-lactam-binding protein with PASTA domain